MTSAEGGGSNEEEVEELVSIGLDDDDEGWLRLLLKLLLVPVRAAVVRGIPLSS